MIAICRKGQAPDRRHGRDMRKKGEGEDDVESDSSVTAATNPFFSKKNLKIFAKSQIDRITGAR